MTTDILAEDQAKETERPSFGSPVGRLTKRQSEVLRLVAEGSSSKQIAVRLGLSTKTVEAHRGAIMDRLGIHNLAGLVRFALRTGLVAHDR